MKKRIGIIGYGNLGHAVEKELYTNNKYNLVAIFSKRDVKSFYSTPVKRYEEISNFIDKIDVMIMCGGSKSDLMWQSPEALKNFDIIDTFDTHALIPKHATTLNTVATTNKHRAIYSCGWDPGLFSLYKLLDSAILHGKTNVFWGKGVSQGHSDALRKIEGVQDAIQYTVPDPKIVKLSENKNFDIDNNQKHLRVCYVAISPTANLTKIEKEIRNMPYYFKGQRVEIHFVHQKDITKLKQKMYHAGKVISIDENNIIKHEVKMSNNPEFTAKIVIAYIDTLEKLGFGAYSILDIPPKYLSINYSAFL